MGTDGRIGQAILGMEPEPAQVRRAMHRHPELSGRGCGEARPDRLRRIAEGACAAMRAAGNAAFREGTPPVVNDPQAAEVAGAARGWGNVMGNVITLPRLAYVPDSLLCVGRGTRLLCTRRPLTSRMRP